jgi:2-polyprenyl-6-methoxyphenol hydroxylase-like FAD-dependent oxidoreductase
MPNPTVEIDILIVGAGPVGLFLANECARRSIRFRIIEARASQSIYSKALAIFPRTLEIFDMAGVVAPFLEQANRVTKVAVISHDHALARLLFEPHDTPYPFVAMVPQDVTERLLADELRRRGGEVEYNTVFVSATQDHQAVIATANHDGQVLQIKASFLVGCDGAHSAVRSGLNLGFEGGAYHDSYLLADIETNTTLPADEMQLCPSEFGPLAIFPMSAIRRRVVATIDPRAGDAPSLDLVRDIIAQRAPAGLEARALHWSSYFQIHHRHASKLRQGRIFIAGDAAHIHSPFGGQGMNTGLHDVWNLVWKLDLFLRGHGNQQLLASYDAERLPVIKSVIDTTDSLTKAMGTKSKFAQALRDAVIPMVSHIAPFHHALVERLSELGIAYRGSPIVEGPGKRYFDDSLRGGRILSRYLVLTANEDTAAQQTAHQLRKSLPELIEFRRSPDQGVKLIRPDGYIAYAAPRGDDAVFDELRSILARQTSPTDALVS